MSGKSEKQIERECRKYAENLGWLALKMTCPGYAGVPDRIFISPKGRVEFVEFKKETGRLSPIQVTMIKQFENHGHEVQVIRDLHGFKMWVMEE